MTILDDFEIPEVTAASVNKKVTHELDHFTADVDLNKVVLDFVGGTKRDIDIRPAVIDGEIEDPIDASPTIRLTVHDPEWQLFSSGVFGRAIDFKIGSRFYRLDGMDFKDDDITLIFAIRNAIYLSYKTQHKKVSRSKATRAEFILSAIRSVKKVKIRYYSKELHKKQAVLKPEENKKKRQKNRDPGLPREGIKVKGFPADADQIDNLEAVLIVGANMGAPERALVGAVMCVNQESAARRSATVLTRYGLQVGLFQQRKSAGWPATRNPYKDAPAFFRRFIPIIKSNPGGSLGELIDKVQVSGLPRAYDQWQDEAEDIVGAFISGDVPKSIQYAKQYAFEIGGDPDEDGEDENYLAGIYRLAEEVAWRFFWVGNDARYDSEETLFKSAPRMTLRRNTPGVEGVSGTWDTGKKLNKMTITCRMERWICPVGSTIYFAEGSKDDTRGKWLVTNIRRPIFSNLGEIELSKPTPPKKEPAHEIGTKAGQGIPDAIDTHGGAKAIVDAAAAIAERHGGYVGSSFRAGSVTTSGNPSDHSENSANRAARDLGIPGINLLTGPPSPKLDAAVVEIGRAFGKSYSKGQTIIDTFHWHGYQVQIIWRTTKYGGHMGHIHIGVHWDSAGKPGDIRLDHGHAPGGFGSNP